VVKVQSMRALARLRVLLGEDESFLQSGVEGR
jgi:hypothetical protein